MLNIINFSVKELNEEKTLIKITAFLEDRFNQICDIESVEQNEEWFLCNWVFRDPDKQTEFEKFEKEWRLDDFWNDGHEIETIEVSFDDLNIKVE